MNTRTCDQLDDYLADWLSKGERAEFQAHLADCPSCRVQLEQQRRIDRLITLAAEQFEPVPPALIDSIETRIQSLRHRRRVRLAWSLTTAAMVVLLVGVWSASQQRKPIIVEQVEPVACDEDVEPPARLASHNERPVRVTLRDPSAGILVPMETKTPNVSVVWVYPTVQPARLHNGAENN